MQLRKEAFFMQLHQIAFITARIILHLKVVTVKYQENDTGVHVPTVVAESSYSAQSPKKLTRHYM